MVRAFALLCAGLFIAAACGEVDRSPLVSEPNGADLRSSAAGEPSAAAFTVGFSPDPPAPGALTKPSTRVRRARKEIKPEKGGQLGVAFGHNKIRHAVGVKKTKLKVYKGSIKNKHTVTMTVFSGTTLEDVLVEFTPAGLDFHPPARLSILLEGELTQADLDDLKAYHTSRDGSVTEVPLKVYFEDDGTWMVVIIVPGFSYYDIAADDECIVVDQDP